LRQKLAGPFEAGDNGAPLSAIHRAQMLDQLSLGAADTQTADHVDDGLRRIGAHARRGRLAPCAAQPTPAAAARNDRLTLHDRPPAACAKALPPCRTASRWATTARYHRSGCSARSRAARLAHRTRAVPTPAAPTCPRVAEWRRPPPAPPRSR